MKIYYSNVKFESLPLKDMKIGILVSFYGLKKLNRFSYCNSLFLDSGAFSAWTKAANIDLSLYISFIKKNIEKIDIYASLDDILSYEISLENYFKMREAGLTPLPCFHYGEPLFVLEEYLKTTDYVALGKIAKVDKKSRIYFLNRIFEKYKGVKFHGFGIGDRHILGKYPWYSIDSTSCHVLARFGGICTPFGDLKINPNVKSKNLQWITPITITKIKDWVQSLGFFWEDLIEHSPRGVLYRTLLNIIYYESLCLKLNNNKKIYIKNKGLGLI